MKPTTLLMLGSMGVAGCATVAIPTENVAKYEAAARSADELGGQNVPEAQLHLKLAQDESAAAKKLASENDERAMTMMARAQVDAELAVSLARQKSVRDEAKGADEKLRAVQGSPDTQVTP